VVMTSGAMRFHMLRGMMGGIWGSSLALPVLREVPGQDVRDAVTSKNMAIVDANDRVKPEARVRQTLPVVFRAMVGTRRCVPPRSVRWLGWFGASLDASTGIRMWGRSMQYAG